MKRRLFSAVRLLLLLLLLAACPSCTSPETTRSDNVEQSSEKARLLSTALPPPVVGAEFGMDPPVYGSHGNAADPAVASNGSGMSLVVWNADDDIAGMRVSSTGALLDPVPIAIAPNPGLQEEPAVSYDWTNWLVVWTSYNGDFASADIHAARVSADGVVIDLSGIAVSTAANAQTSPAVGHDGTNWLVAWADRRDGTGAIFGARVDPSGGVLDANGFLIATAGTPSAISHDGTNWLVLSQRTTGASTVQVFGTRVASSGIVLDPNGIPISTAERIPRAATLSHDGTNWLVVWHRDGAIYGTRVSSAGVVLEGTPIGLSISGADSTPDVLHDGTNWLVVWGSDRVRISARLVAPSGSPIGAQLRVASWPPEIGVSRQPVVASDGAGWLVAWADRLPSVDIYGIRIAPNGSALHPSPFRISSGANIQSDAAAAFNGTSWLVVWRDFRNASDIYATRVGESGTVLDTNAIALATNTNGSTNDGPAVASNGTDWLVVWQQEAKIQGTRVSADGTVLDANGIAISVEGSSYQPSVSSDGTQWMVAFTKQPEQVRQEIYVARVSANGEVRDPSGIAVSESVLEEWRPRISYGGQNWLVVWEQLNLNSNWDMYGARVNVDGVVLDRSGIALATGPGHQNASRVSHDGTNWLAAWLHSSGTDGWLVRAARVNADGVLLDPSGFSVAMLTAGAGGLAPANLQGAGLAHDGTNWFFTWWGSRDQNSLEYPSDLWNVYGARVGGDGSVLDTSRIPIASNTGDGIGVAAGPGGKMLVTYESRPIRHPRVKARVITPSCDGEPTDGDSDGVPDCTDACAAVPAATPDGCPSGGGGPGGAAGMGGGGSSGAGAGGIGGAIAGNGGQAAGGGIGGSGGMGGSSGASANGGAGMGGGGATDAGGAAGSDDGGGGAGEGGNGASSDAGEPGGGVGASSGMGGGGESAGEGGIDSGSSGAAADDDAGCDCRGGTTRPSSSPTAIIFAVAALGVTLRRKRRLSEMADAARRDVT